MNRRKYSGLVLPCSSDFPSQTWTTKCVAYCLVTCSAFWSFQIRTVSYEKIDLEIECYQTLIVFHFSSTTTCNKEGFSPCFNQLELIEKLLKKARADPNNPAYINASSQWSNVDDNSKLNMN